MKIINKTDCHVSTYLLHGQLHLTVTHPDRSWKGGTDYKGGGYLTKERKERHAAHFEVMQGELLSKQFCLIPENEEEENILKGFWYYMQNKEQELFVCIPYANNFDEIKEIPLTNAENGVY